MASSITRRASFTALGGAAAAASMLWPSAARAQQRERVRRIGVLMPLAADDPEGQARLTAFLQGLRELGWTDGRNVRIETRWTAGKPDEIRKYSAEFAALAPDVILAAATPIVAALQPATRTVPIVFVLVSDPVAAGFVDSLSRPGGNATGFTQFEYGISGKVARTAQRDQSKRHQSGRRSRRHRASRGWTIRRHPELMAAAKGVETRPINAGDPVEMERDIGSFASAGQTAA